MTADILIYLPIYLLLVGVCLMCFVISIAISIEVIGGIIDDTKDFIYRIKKKHRKCTNR